MRLRVGVALWITSWLPVAQVVGASDRQRLVIWGIQVVMGIIGLALAGVVFAEAIKVKGWRGAPGVAWRAMLHGTSPAEAVDPAPADAPSAEDLPGG